MSDTSYDPDLLPQPPFTTARLVLRPFLAKDAAVVHQALDTDPEVWRFDPGYAPSLRERRAMIRHYAALRTQFGFAPCGAWARDGTFVGQGGLNAYLYDQRDGSRSVEFEVMYKLARPFWRQGFALEVARFWTEFAFRQVRLPQLKICPARANAASIGVLRALGATFEDDWLDPDTVIATILAPAV
jgi:ribosomal-protein-alanine N-acetyltransferase